MTFGNEKEFAEHETIAAELDADVDFAHPYHSWERGLDVNSNRLLRQYFPKGMELAEAAQEQVQRAVDKSTIDYAKCLDSESRLRSSSGRQCATPNHH
ncbi:Integrase, catalytic region (fragment) [Nitrosomonas mobilis]|uniref:Integrase, catalytic region n=1 Tax=Nitrosomonas mobilis TaxID=51642 RepID=A0A1G5SEP3_9PROT